MRSLAGTGTLAAAALTAHTAYNLTQLRRPPPAPASRVAPLVSVLIPARDEAANIEACVAAVLGSRGVVLEVLVLDDGSTDDTARIVDALARDDRRVRLITGAQPPDGWLGKPYACSQLAAAATGTVLAFVDADVRLEPDALARTAALLDYAGLDLVSPYPRQLALTPAERLVQPLLQWSWLTFLPLRLAEVSALPRLVAANGQFLVCRRQAYRTAGGHAVVRDAVLDDLELARAFKRAGLRATVVDGTEIATCRMYEGWAEVRDGYSKSLWAATGGPVSAAAVGALLAWVYVVPPVAALRRLRRGEPSALVPALGWAAAGAGRAAAARRTGGRPADAVAHPLSVATVLGLALRSAILRRSGRLTWKGRPIPGSR